MIPCKWIRKAVEDLVVAGDEAEKITWASVFHSQQAVEKALKALLASIGVQPPKTHSIEYLLFLLKERGMDTSQIKYAARLSDYAVEARYPDFEEEPSVEEALNALAIARSVVEWVIRQLSLRGIEC